MKQSAVCGLRSACGEQSRTAISTFGRYTADDLQRAMRLVLARADLRRLHGLRQAQRYASSFDARPDGRLVPV